MKKNKKIIFGGMSSLFALGAPLAMVVSCGSGDKYSIDDTIAMIVSTKNNPYFVSLLSGAEAEAKAQGYKLKIYVSNDDATKESAAIDNVITAGYKTLILNGLDATQSAAGALKASKAGIKVIAVDRKLDSSANVWTTVSSDNEKGAKDLATKVIEKFIAANKSSIEMLHLQGLAGEANGIQRWNGVSAAISENAGFKTSSSYKARANYDRAKGNTETSTQLTAHPNIKWISADNDEMALGAYSSIKAKAGVDFNSKVIITGFDGNNDAIAAVDAEQIYGTVKQDAVGMGKTAVDAAIEAWGKKDFDNIKMNVDTLVEVKVITKENVKNFK